MTEDQLLQAVVTRPLHDAVLACAGHWEVNVNQATLKDLVDLEQHWSTMSLGARKLWLTGFVTCLRITAFTVTDADKQVEAMLGLDNL